MRMPTLDAHVEAVKQVAVADRIVVTKADLVDDAEQIAALRARLRGINPGAAILDVGDRRGVGGRCSSAGSTTPGPRPPTCAAGSGEEAHAGHDGDHHGHDHDHDHAGHATITPAATTPGSRPCR